MKLKRLPECVRKLRTVAARQKAMQLAVNDALHRNNICPQGEYMCGVRAPRVGVTYQTHPRGWYVHSNFDEPNADAYEHLAVQAIQSMQYAHSDD